MQRGFLNKQSDGIFGAGGRKRKSPAASSGSSGPGPVSGAAGSASTGSSGPDHISGADKKDAGGEVASSSSGADGQGGFGAYSQDQVQHFVRQLKHMDMLGLEVYVTESGAIFDREALRQIIKRFDS